MIKINNVIASLRGNHDIKKDNAAWVIPFLRPLLAQTP